MSDNMKKMILSALLALSVNMAMAQGDVLQTATMKRDLTAKVNEQVYFPETVPPGNYSGITWLGGSLYAVVSDKSKRDGFFIFHINIDPDTGQISHAYSNEFRGEDYACRDNEGIAFVAQDSTIFISGETGNRILEYRLDNGHRTGRELAVPDSFRQSRPNLGFESLSYNPVTRRFWTVSESVLPMDGEACTQKNKKQNNLRLLCFDENLQFVAEYPYLMDYPVLKSKTANGYAMGVADVCALDDGRVIVLERELYVPQMKLGSFVNCKLYVVDPSEEGYSVALHKKLLTQFKTVIKGVKNDFANYEGMCLGQKLNDGSQVLVMICDSQDQKANVLHDYLRTVIIK